MVIPQRKDGGAVTRRSQGRRPIVLARLPQVGSSSPPVLSDVSSAPQSIHDDSHTDPSTMLLPPLRQDLPREGEGLNLYVDQGHSHSHRLATDRITVSDPAKNHRPASYPQLKKASILHQLQVQLAPHAGLIVAMALIASAGLLYWLIIGPTQTPIDYHKMSNDGFDRISAETSENFTQEHFPEGRVIVSEQWAADPPTEDPPAELSSTDQPDAIDLLETDSPPAIDLLKTDNPAAFDFAKLSDSVEAQPSEEFNKLPEIAERFIPQIIEPIKR